MDIEEVAEVVELKQRGIKKGKLHGNIAYQSEWYLIFIRQEQLSP